MKKLSGEDIGRRSLYQKESETDRGYECFLLWCIQDEKLRTNRGLGKLVGCTEGAIRKWKKKDNWESRFRGCVNAEFVALELYRERIGYQHSDERKEKMKLALEAILGNAPASMRSYIRRQLVGVPTILEAIDVNERKYAEDKRKRGGITMDEVREEFLTKDSVGRQIKLIDATMGYIAKKVAKGDIRVSVRDIPALIKARALLTGSPTQHIHVTGHQEVVVKESPRVQVIRRDGGTEIDVVGAMEEDLRELGVILGAVKLSSRQEEEHNRRRIIDLDEEGKLVDSGVIDE